VEFGVFLFVIANVLLVEGIAVVDKGLGFAEPVIEFVFVDACFPIKTLGEHLHEEQHGHVQLEPHEPIQFEH